MKINYKNLTSIFILIMSLNALAGTKCDIREFKELYFSLQNHLNYAGKDASYDKKSNKLSLVDHVGEYYNGRLFEKAMYKEYQSALNKVAYIYNQNRAGLDGKTNPQLVNFIKAIDANDSGKDIAKAFNIDSNSLFKELAAIKKNDPKFELNQNDIYLLQKLFIHSQDKICSTEKAKGKLNPTLEGIKNSPLNRMINALKNAKLDPSKEIVLPNEVVKEEDAIKSAVLADIAALKKWTSEQAPGCQAKLRNSAAQVQPYIQVCNYQSFVDSLFKNNISNFESVLHFINANQKPNAKAETYLDPLVLESFISTAIKAPLIKPSCKSINNDFFLQNLKYDSQKGFDFASNQITCNGKNNPSNSCDGKIKLESDELGRGIKIKFQNPKESFDIKVAGERCGSFELAIDEPTPPISLTSDKKTDCEKDKKKKYDDSKNECVDRTEAEIAADVVREVADKKTECEKDKKKKFDDKNNSCIDKTESEIAADTARELADKKVDCEKDAKKKFDDTKKECVDKTLAEIELDTAAANASKKTECEKDPKKKFDDVKKECVEKTEAEIAADIASKKADCEKDPKKKFDDTKKECVDKPVTTETEEAKCEKRDADARAADPDNKPIKYFEFKNGNCIDLKADKDKKGDKKPSATDDSPSDPFKDFLNSLSGQSQPSAPRFQPTNIPTRQPYILPGMP